MKYREVNLLGGFYKDASLPWSSQDTVNWLPVPAMTDGTRSPAKLRGVPGLKGLSPDVAPLPQWTTWDPASIIGPGSLESANRTFFRTGENPTTLENEALTGYTRVKGKDPITGPAKYYFEVYSDFPAGNMPSPQTAIRFGICRSEFALGEGNGGNDPLTKEHSWKMDFVGKRGLFHQSGGVNALNAGPAGVTVSQWAGFAVEAFGDVNSVLTVRAWLIIDGNWSSDGDNPLTAPLGSMILSNEFSSEVSLGGVVPMATLYRPRSANPEYVVRANFGQEPFLIGNEAFSPGGPLFGFTKGWPSA